MRRIILIIVVLPVFLATITGCSTGSFRPVLPTVSATPSVSAGTGTASPAALITVPNVVSQNAAVAMDMLDQLGFTNVDLGTADGHRFVALPQNWTVKTQSAPAGDSLRADAKIVLGCVRNG